MVRSSSESSGKRTDCCGAELGQLGLRVRRDAEHGDAGGVELVHRGGEVDRLCRAAGRHRCGVEVDDHPLPGVVRERHLVAVGVGQGEADARIAGGHQSRASREWSCRGPARSLAASHARRSGDPTRSVDDARGRCNTLWAGRRRARLAGPCMQGEELRCV